MNLINKNRKKYIKKDNNIKKDLDNNIIDKLIYIFFQIKYIKIKIYKRYIYIY